MTFTLFDVIFWFVMGFEFGAIVFGVLVAGARK